MRHELVKTSQTHISYNHYGDLIIQITLNVVAMLCTCFVKLKYEQDDQSNNKTEKACCFSKGKAQ